MLQDLEVLILMLLVIAAVAVAANRLKIPPAILLVLTGVVLAILPGLPAVDLAPDLLLLLVLPPIIYSSAVAMSWCDFRFNLRPIALLAVGCVLFTTAAVAAATHWMLGLSWPIGFLLGAIVSPPDAVAPLAIARRLEVPRRLIVVLEGEGLANDATALVLYRFAVAAVTLGSFSFSHALGTFACIVVGEVLWGIGVGWVMLRLRRWVRDPRIEIMLSVLTPFAAYWPPQHLGGSGVLATVCAGLYISWNGLRLISAATRLQGIFFWDFLIYLIEGMVFLLTGLQARALIQRIAGVTAKELVISAVVTSLVVIVTRFIWVYPATYIPRWIPSIRRRDPPPPWQIPFALAFTGVRGVVSLAAALAIPLTIENGQPFPDRELVLFLTFIVILVTLIGQGLALPAVIRALGLAKLGRRERHRDRAEEFEARRKAIEAAMARLDAVAAERNLAEDLVNGLRAHLRGRLRQVTDHGHANIANRARSQLVDDIELELLAAEREAVNDFYQDSKLKAEARLHIERELDLREARIHSLLAEE
ncbi:MAG TPA: Na+/H+ antiporter [Steroidobacteraceae bacterium]|nr:Na+/H+ antiporter [Steroidobacteraceae bacterium]